MLKQAAPDRDTEMRNPENSQFTNHASAHKCADSVMKEVEKYVTTRVIIQWTGANPCIISGLLVAEGTKLRLLPGHDVCQRPCRV